MSNESPLLLSANAASGLLGIGVTLFRTMDSDGRLGPRSYQCGRRRLWRRKELEGWTDAGLPPRVQWQSERGEAV